MGRWSLLFALTALLAGAIPGELASQEPRPRLPGRELPRVGKPTPPVPTPSGSVVNGELGCPPEVSEWWLKTVGTGAYGRIACAQDPTRPAVLLFHGGQQDGRVWTAPSHTESAYDHKQHPRPVQVGSTHEQPASGVYKVSTSKWLYGPKQQRAAWDAGNNWFDFLVKQGFTVATWSQNGRTMDDAMKSTRLAFDSFLVQTAARSPATPPPVALIGHGRGGLVIRQILKEKGSEGRVKWAVTLHSPHRGTELSRQPAAVNTELVDLLNCCTGTLHPQQVAQLKPLLTQNMLPMVGMVTVDQQGELAPGSPLLQHLADGEKQLGDVTYYTFGGVNPRVYRLYLWKFLQSSAIPDTSATKGQYYEWRAAPEEVSSISPVLDKIRDIVPEVAPGKGDGAVTDASSRLPWSIHGTTSLNHLEPLWDKPLMMHVAGLIGRRVAASTPRR